MTSLRLREPESKGVVRSLTGQHVYVAGCASSTHRLLPERDTASLSARPLLRLARSESWREAGQYPAYVTCALYTDFARCLLLPSERARPAVEREGMLGLG